MRGTFPAGARFGAYEILSLLGINLGEIYRARTPQQKEDVVLKVFSGAALGPAVFEEKKSELEREAHVAKALDNHTNIVGIYDVGTWNGWLFIVMELIEGQSLRERLRVEPLRVSACIDYALQTARLLVIAHERGIVHGHLSLPNMLITIGERVKVLGFGSRPGSDPPFSTVGYAAPEQILQKQWDCRADIFSLGSILHEMLGGASPFQGSSVTETIRATLEDEPRPLSQRNPPIPSALEQLVNRCLAKEPAERPQSARELACELEKLHSAKIG